MNNEKESMTIHQLFSKTMPYITRSPNSLQNINLSIIENNGNPFRILPMINNLTYRFNFPSMVQDYNKLVGCQNPIFFQKPEVKK